MTRTNNLWEFFGVDALSAAGYTGELLRAKLTELRNKDTSFYCPGCRGEPVKIPQNALEQLFCKCGDQKSCKMCPVAINGTSG